MTKNLTRKLSHKMRHLIRNLKSDFNQPFHFSAFAPGCLINHFLYPIFLNRINIAFAGFNQLANLFPRGRHVAIFQVLAYQIAVFCKLRFRAIVTINHHAFFVAYSGCTINFFQIIEPHKYVGFCANVQKKSFYALSAFCLPYKSRSPLTNAYYGQLWYTKKADSYKSASIIKYIVKK